MPDPLISLLVAAAITALGLFIFWPDRGPFWRWQRARRLTERVLSEDALKHIQQCAFHGDRPSIKSMAGALNISPNQVMDVIARLESHGLLRMEGADFHLTASGRDYAMRVIRAHRLYERYLAEATGFDEAEWHQRAELVEHTLSPEEIAALATQLGNPTHDPHGHPIPTASGEMVYHNGKALPTMVANQTYRIVEIEDQPEVVYAQLVAEGLHPGMEIHLVENSSQRVRFWVGEEEHILAPIMATNIEVVLTEAEAREDELPGEPLTTLKPGEVAHIVNLSPRIRGIERRRLMDLGILPGTLIENEMVSAGGDPVAYRIRGAVIALRNSQAELINICRDGRQCEEESLERNLA
jgi:DtxR family Mn-dependent transcriptional regulator